MARGEYQADVDQNAQIEFGIAQPLLRGETTEVDTATIEKGYNLEDDDNNEMSGTLDEKCSAIVVVLKDEYSVDAEYSIRRGTTQIRPKRPR